MQDSIDPGTSDYWFASRRPLAPEAEDLMVVPDLPAFPTARTSNRNDRRDRGLCIRRVVPYQHVNRLTGGAW